CVSHSSSCDRAHRPLHSFPTRRSSDLPVLTTSSDRTRSNAALRLRHESSRATIAAPCPVPRAGARVTREPRFSRVDRFESHLPRSEEHTSELQSRENLVCRLLLEKKKN